MTTMAQAQANVQMRTGGAMAALPQYQCHKKVWALGKVIL